MATKRARRRSREVAAQNSARNTFGALARQFVEQEQRDRRHNRTWKKQARDTLGLVYDDDDAPPTIRPGSLVYRWCDKPVSEITADEVRSVIRESYRSGVPGRTSRVAGVASSREREMNKTLSRMLTWLHREGLIDGTALAGIHPAEPGRDRDRVLLDKELKALWTALDDSAFSNVIRVIILTGVRRGEAEAMRWDELSSDWTIPAARHKSKRAHVIPLSAR